MTRIHPFKLFIILVAVLISIACCMLPKTYKGSVEQTQQEGVIFFDNGIEDLILKVDPKITGDAELKNMCWLITVPNEPDKYDVVSPSIFESLYDLKTKHLVIPRRESSIGCSKKSSGDKAMDASEAYPGVELGKFVQVGNYDIQPVRGVGKHALSGLNNWLEQNGFPTEPEDHMKYFVDNKFTFLCIKVNSMENGSIGFTPELKPLHLTFKSDLPYYPMKYSSQQGEFSANIYTFSTLPIDYSQSQNVLNKLNVKNYNLFKNVNLANKELPDKVSELLGKEKDYLYFNNFYCSNPNYKKAISKWKEDIFFQLNNSHWPNRANQMKGQISWPRTALLVLGIITFVVIARKKWKRSPTPAK